MIKSSNQQLAPYNLRPLLQRDLEPAERIGVHDTLKRFPSQMFSDAKRELVDSGGGVASLVALLEQQCHADWAAWHLTALSSTTGALAAMMSARGVPRAMALLMPAVHALQHEGRSDERQAGQLMKSVLEAATKAGRADFHQVLDAMLEGGGLAAVIAQLKVSAPCLVVVNALLDAIGKDELVDFERVAGALVDAAGFGELIESLGSDPTLGDTVSAAAECITTLLAAANRAGGEAFKRGPSGYDSFSAAKRLRH